MKEDWDREWQYRYDERLAIMCEDREPTEEQKEIAKRAADKQMRTLRLCARKRQFTDRWCEEYAKAHRFKYVFNGSIDGQAADRMIRADMRIEGIISIAIEAWKHPDWFNCKQAASLAGFVSRFNEIQGELQNPPVQNGARLMLFRDEYNRILARMKALRETYSGMQSWRQEDKDEFIRLRDRRNEVRSILGMVV